MEIHKIRIPVTGQSEDAVMRRYALYFANKLQASLLGIHAGKALPPGKPTDSSQEEDHGPFQAFIRDCQGRGIAFETLRHNDSWQKAMDNV